MSDWLMPVKDGEDPYTDPYEKAKLLKKKNILQNQMANVKNIDRAALKIGKKGASPIVSIPELNETSDKGSSKSKFGKGKVGTKRMLEDVAVSTASMGRFDEVVSGEGERTKVTAKRRKYEDNLNLSKEKNRDLGVLAKLIGGDEGGKLRKLSKEVSFESGSGRKGKGKGRK